MAPVTATSRDSSVHRRTCSPTSGTSAGTASGSPRIQGMTVETERRRGWAGARREMPRAGGRSTSSAEGAPGGRQT